MADADNGMLSEFTTVTGVTEDRAKFYLESANWNLQVNTQQIYENASQCKYLAVIAET